MPLKVSPLKTCNIILGPLTKPTYAPSLWHHSRKFNKKTSIEIRQQSQSSSQTLSRNTLGLFPSTGPKQTGQLIAEDFIKKNLFTFHEIFNTLMWPVKSFMGFWIINNLEIFYFLVGPGPNTTPSLLVVVATHCCWAGRLLFFFSFHLEPHIHICLLSRRRINNVLRLKWH